MIDPQLTLQMSFVEDCLMLYDTVLESLAPAQGKSEDDDNAAPGTCSDSLEMPFVVQVRPCGCQLRTAFSLCGGFKRYSGYVTCYLQAQIHGGSIIVPAKAEARSALVGFARTLTLGLPAQAIAGVNTSLVTASAGSKQRQMLGTSQPLPDVSHLMELSGRVLHRHRAMTQIRGRRTEPSPPSDYSQASDGSSAAAGSAGVNDGSESGAGVGLNGMKEWLKRRMDGVKPLWSAAGSVIGHHPDESQSAEQTPPDVGPWTPEQLARHGQRGDSGRQLHNAEALGGGGGGSERGGGITTADAHAKADAQDVTGGDAVQGGEGAAEVDLCERCFLAVIGDSYQVCCTVQLHAMARIGVNTSDYTACMDCMPSE